MDKYAYEIRLLHCEQSPKAAKGKRWRWDLIVQEQVSGKYRGVKDARYHQTTYFGYARTKWGAERQIIKSYDKAQERFPTYG